LLVCFASRFKILTLLRMSNSLQGRKELLDAHEFSDQFRYRTIRRRNNCNSDDGEA
jgi:hypothetical protein